MIAASTVSLQYQNTSYESEEERQQGAVIKTTRDVSTDVNVSVGVGTGKYHWYFAVSDCLTIFGRCLQYTIDSMVYLIRNEAA